MEIKKWIPWRHLFLTKTSVCMQFFLVFFGNEATLIDYKSARPSVYVSSLWSYRSREQLLNYNIWMLSYYDGCLYQCWRELPPDDDDEGDPVPPRPGQVGAPGHLQVLVRHRRQESGDEDYLFWCTHHININWCKILYRVFIKYCVFSEDFKILRTLAFLYFPSVSVCAHTQGR